MKHIHSQNYKSSSKTRLHFLVNSHVILLCIFEKVELSKVSGIIT